MQFITSGNRIAVENFVLGDLYTITFTNGTYINSACIGIGDNFVTFQRNEPELLFSLTMATAELVSTIELYAGGSGTNNYNDLTNKPQINDIELVGNKSLSDLGIQATISDIDTIRSGAAAGATAVQPAALADYQPIISDLDTIRSGAAAGATAVQPAALADYQTIIDSSHKLDADLVDDTTATHKFATAAQLAQIGINENNISYIAKNIGRNILNIQKPTENVQTSVTNGPDNSITLAVSQAKWTRLGYLINVAPNAEYRLVIYVDNADLENVRFQCFVYESDASGSLLSGIGRTPLITSTGTITSEVISSTSEYVMIIIALNNSASPGTGSATIRAMYLEEESYQIDSAYTLPALSNAELTAAIQALQAQLANQ